MGILGCEGTFYRGMEVVVECPQDICPLLVAFCDFVKLLLDVGGEVIVEDSGNILSGSH